MGVDIKSRFDGRVLYKAKGAADVREAVEAARRDNANLGGAYLRYANLRYANLRYAYLRGADLGDANLGGADLRDANLRGADLRDADLGYANLGYANLGGADLWDANLGYANLGGADLRYANLGDANLRYANLRDANLGGADLRYANLWGANLRDANLRDANLGDANLRYANLGDANLGGANLRDAKGFAPERVNDLLMLLDQVGPIRAYKLVGSEYRSPIQPTGKLTYKVGDTVEAEADPDPTVQCGKGVNVATLPWCLANWESGYRILVVEFKKADIAAIPVGDGKFRVSKVKVVREIDRDQINAWLGRGVD